MTCRAIRGLVGLTIGLAWAAPAVAELMVIYDSGKTQSLVPYLQILETAKDSGSTDPLSRPRASEALGPANIDNQLPLRSPGLSPGSLRQSGLNVELQRRFALGAPRPFFLVGSDPMSQHWLRKHRARQVTIGAVGMLVQAETREDIQDIAKIAQGLSISVGSATDLAKALGIKRYPVLITAKGLEQ
jgi:integrating conjugative element protein (TIGR03765 family)